MLLYLALNKKKKTRKREMETDKKNNVRVQLVNQVAFQR